MKKVQMGLFKTKNNYSALILTFNPEESEQAKKKLIFMIQNALKSNFAGIELNESRRVTEFLQRDP